MISADEISAILNRPVPLWALAATVVILVAMFARRISRITSRLDAHAKSIAHMDEWADWLEEWGRGVDTNLQKAKITEQQLAYVRSLIKNPPSERP